jgi:hypothetical protein
LDLGVESLVSPRCERCVLGGYALYCDVCDLCEALGFPTTCKPTQSESACIAYANHHNTESPKPDASPGGAAPARPAGPV